MVSINIVTWEKTAPWIQFLVLHFIPYIFTMFHCMNVCACAHTRTLPSSLRNYNTIIHSEALTVRRMKQVLLSYTMSNKPFCFLIFFFMLHFIYQHQGEPESTMPQQVRKLTDFLFLSSTQAPFRCLTLGGSLFKLISFLSPTPLINQLKQGQLEGSLQYNNI